MPKVSLDEIEDLLHSDDELDELKIRRQERKEKKKRELIINKKIYKIEDD